MAMTNSSSPALAKVARIRRPGFPAGVRAPMTLNCPCGADVPAAGSVATCACGARYDAAGYVQPTIEDLRTKLRAELATALAHEIRVVDALPERATRRQLDTAWAAAEATNRIHRALAALDGAS